jgi:hypothetical protein
MIKWPHKINISQLDMIVHLFYIPELVNVLFN